MVGPELTPVINELIKTARCAVSKNRAERDFFCGARRKKKRIEKKEGGEGVRGVEERGY